MSNLVSYYCEQKLIKIHKPFKRYVYIYWDELVRATVALFNTLVKATVAHPNFDLTLWGGDSPCMSESFLNETVNSLKSNLSPVSDSQGRQNITVHKLGLEEERKTSTKGERFYLEMLKYIN